jgi:hypothetical protein
MRLFEEYFQRNQITQVPVVHHCAYGSLLLRTNDPSVWSSKWVLVNLKWQHSDSHPGKYHFDISLPVHDGFLKGNLFQKYPTVEKNWQDYEDFIINWSSNIYGVEPVIGTKEIFLCAWEMFVFMCDGWFMKQTYEIKEFLFQTLNVTKLIKKIKLILVHKNLISKFRDIKCNYIVLDDAVDLNNFRNKYIKTSI